MTEEAGHSTKRKEVTCATSLAGLGDPTEEVVVYLDMC